MAWDTDTLKARIANQSGRERHLGGSPDGREIALYARLACTATQRQTACCLGMTPELRRELAEHFDQLISVDQNPAAIALYADWLPTERRGKEQIIHGDWPSFLQAQTPHSFDPFDVSRHPLSEQHWYSYYKVHQFRPT